MKRKIIAIVVVFVVIGVSYFIKMSMNNSNNTRNSNNATNKDKNGGKNMSHKLINGVKNLETIYLAGGCFWGVEEYFSRVFGIEDAESGYANGKEDKASYEKLKDSGHAETVKVVYDKNKISLGEILLRYFTLIEPTSVNKQGNDVGTQYRTGIYYVNDKDLDKIKQVFDIEQEKYDKKIAVEVAKLNHFVKAEDYHQDYLAKNPHGYCHIDVTKATKPLDIENFKKDINLGEITKLQKHVTMEKGTERPGSSEYDKFDEKGVYVDIYTGQPLFSSSDKFDAGCGWPSFSKPILTSAVQYDEDKSLGMNRVEVTSTSKSSHLGHVFEDGPKDKGGLRYCINGASLKFIPYDEMEKYGLKKYKVFVD